MFRPCKRVSKTLNHVDWQNAAFMVPKRRASNSTNRTNRTNRTTVVALSGGVDSAVTAALLKESQSSAQIVSIHMSNWNHLDELNENSQLSCSSDIDWKDAVQIASHLDIPLTRLSLERDYWCHVFDPYVQALWQTGRMGNPDVDCNTHVKFGALSRHLRDIYGTNVQLATGHYARLWHRQHNSKALPESVEKAASSGHESTLDWLRTWGNNTNRGDPSTLLLAGADATKDQSYFLSGCNADAFRHVSFPLGDLCKSSSVVSHTDASLSHVSVRNLAERYDIPVATKRDSMGLCFVGKRPSGFASFVSEYLPRPRHRLRFVDVDTNAVLSETDTPAHPFFYTPGQGARLSGTPEKCFVVDHGWNKTLARRHATDQANPHVVLVCRGTHHPALYSDWLSVDHMHWLNDTPPWCHGTTTTTRWRAQCRIRHLQPLVDCTVVRLDNGQGSYRIDFDTPVRGIAPGQVAAVYTLNGLVCLGSGSIAARGPSYWQTGQRLPLDRLHPSGHNDTSVERP